MSGRRDRRLTSPDCETQPRRLLLFMCAGLVWVSDGGKQGFIDREVKSGDLPSMEHVL